MEGTIRLVNAVFFAHHGVFSEEHRLGGRFEVDVAMKVDFADAAYNDDLTRTVDYGAVYELVRGIVMKNSFYLIERLAVLIADAILAQLPMVVEAEVTVRKPNPPVGGTCDAAEVSFVRRR